MRAGRRWPSAKRATRAVTSGAIAIVTSTLATVVIVIATMKAVNITDQQTPESQSVAPPLRKVCASAAPAAQPAEQDDAARRR